MKRNSVTKKILSLVLCLLMVATIVPLSAIQSSAANMVSWDYTLNNGKGIAVWHPYVVRWKTGKTTEWGNPNKPENPYNHNAIALHSVNGKLAYCIIPGVKIKSGNGYFDSFDNGEFVNETKGVLDNLQIEKLVKLVMAFGYPSGKSKPNNYSSELYKAYATQLLIWEIVTGERKADFSYHEDHGYALENIKKAENSTEYLSLIKDPYDDIVKAVRAELARQDKGDTESTSETEVRVNLGTIELEITVRENHLYYEGSVQSDSIKDCNLASLKTLPQEYLSIDRKSGILKVSIPIEEAFKYQKQTYYGELTKTITTQTEETFECLNLAKMPIEIYRGDQQMVVCSEPVSENKTIKNTVHQPYRLSFAIKVPEVHRHNWIPHRINPTCTTQGLMCWECTCGRVITSNYDFTYGSSDPTKFDFKTGIAPAEGHDSGVTVTTVMPTCSTKGETQTLCTKCGVVIGSSELAQLGHTKEGEGSVWVVSQEPTAEAKGEMSLLCGRCGAVQKTKEIKQHTHDNKGGEVVITASSCATDGMKGTLCSACGAVYNTKTVPAGHSNKTVKVTNVAATCTKNGEASILCTTCGDILDTEVIPALGHTDDDVWFTAVEPTCTADGEIRKLCTRCGEVTDAKAADALGHDDGVWTTTIEPTCELDGEQVLNCTRCGKVEDSKPIAKLGHDAGAWRIDIEATADHDGSMNLYCTRCGMVQDKKAFGQHKHEKGYTKTLLQATCTRDGEQGTVCAICNAIFETEKIAAAGHSYLAPYQNGNGTHSMKCENCEYVYTENCSLVTTDYANSYTNIGYRVHVCTLCGYNYTDGYTKAMGHDYEKWANYNSSSHVRYCTRCPVAEYTLHVWSPYYFNGDETVMEPGTKTKTCIYCGTEHTIEGEDSGFATAVNVSLNSLEFSLRVLEFFNKIMTGVKKVLSIIFDFIR